jgi:hypothetical protein
MVEFSEVKGAYSDVTKLGNGGIFADMLDFFSDVGGIHYWTIDSGRADRLRWGARRNARLPASLSDKGKIRIAPKVSLTEEELV